MYYLTNFFSLLSFILSLVKRKDLMKLPENLKCVSSQRVFSLTVDNLRLWFSFWLQPMAMNSEKKPYNHLPEMSQKTGQGFLLWSQQINADWVVRLQNR